MGHFFTYLVIYVLFDPKTVFVGVLFIFIRLPYNEFRTKAKQIQNVSMYVYWLGHWLADVIVILILCLYVLLLSLLLDKQDLCTAGDFGEISIFLPFLAGFKFCSISVVLFPVFFVSGCAHLLSVYVASQVFSKTIGSLTFFSYMHLLISE
jgi:hypothetical protein